MHGGPKPESDLREALRWALESSQNPAQAMVDWLARDCDPRAGTVLDLLTSPEIPLSALTRAKEAYKSLRLLGESLGERQLAARYYLGTIATALVRFNTRISSQSDAALIRGLDSMLNDPEMPDEMKEIGDLALEWIRASKAASRR